MCSKSHQVLIPQILPFVIDWNWSRRAVQKRSCTRKFVLSLFTSLPSLNCRVCLWYWKREILLSELLHVSVTRWSSVTRWTKTTYQKCSLAWQHTSWFPDISPSVSALTSLSIPPSLNCPALSITRHPIYHLMHVSQPPLIKLPVWLSTFCKQSNYSSVTRVAYY